MKKDSLGIHILLSFFNCNKESLTDARFIKQILDKAVIESGLTKVGESFHQFEPYGATGVLLLSESHICIHTWPEFGSAAIDIFCCGSEEKANQVAQILINEFKPELFEKKSVYR